MYSATQQQHAPAIAMAPNMTSLGSAPPRLTAGAASALGCAVGEADVGSDVGAAVGDADGAVVGDAVGGDVGAGVGGSVGAADGAALGIGVGAGDGGTLGTGVGRIVGSGDGAGVGEKVSTDTESTVALAMLARRRAADGAPSAAHRCTVSVNDPSLTAFERTVVTWLCIDASVSSGYSFATRMRGIVTSETVVTPPVLVSAHSASEKLAF